MRYFVAFICFIICTGDVFSDITSGVTESFDAAFDTAGDSVWSANIGGSSDWNFGSAQTPVTVSNAETPGITKAYQFPAAVATETTNYQAAFSTSSNVTIEIWFKPDSMDVRQTLFECGGSTDGSAISLSFGWLTITGRDDPDFVEVYIKPDDLTDRHHQLVVVFEFDGSGGGSLHAYLDGSFVCSSTDSGFGDWSGANGVGLGQIDATVASGVGNDEFTGEISLFRIYDNKALNASEVLNNYETVATATPVAIIDKNNRESELNVTAYWDADQPGDDPSNSWQASHLVRINGFSDKWTFGGTSPTLTTIASSNYLFNQAYYFDGSGYGTSEVDMTNSSSNMLFEIWIKPDDLTGQETLMEFGGADDGLTLALDNTDFLFHLNDTGGNVLQVRADLSAVGASEFIHCAGFIDLNSDYAYAYINGELIASANIASLNNFAGSNSNGLGDVQGTNGLGYGNYEGYISYIQLTTRSPDDTQLTVSDANTLIQNSFIDQHKGRGIIFSVE